MKFPTKIQTPRAIAGYIRKLANQIERGRVILVGIESGPTGDPEWYGINPQRLVITCMVPVRAPRAKRAARRKAK